MKGSPFNAIVVSGAPGEQSLIAAARAHGLMVVSTAPAVGVDGVVTPQKVDELTALPNQPVVALRDGVWPHVQVQQRGGDAGPTGSPWLDSNGWAIQLAQAKAPNRTIWVLADPPAKGAVLRPEHYLIAVADAAMYGARWPLTISDELRTNAAEWKRLCEAVQFFERQPRGTYRPVARLGVCSAFTGSTADVANEVLNLASRRLLPYRVIDRDRFTAESVTGLQAVLWVDEKAPAGPLRQTLDKFVQRGGLLIVPASVASVADGLKPAARQPTGYALYALGSGRIAVAREPWTDPFLLAGDAHMLLSRRHDVLRLWNAGVVLARYTEDRAGRGRAELLNYAGRASAQPVSLWVAKNFRNARMTALGDAETRALEVQPRNPGTEVHLPPFTTYATVDFEA